MVMAGGEKSLGLLNLPLRTQSFGKRLFLRRLAAYAKKNISISGLFLYFKAEIVVKQCGVQCCLKDDIPGKRKNLSELCGVLQNSFFEVVTSNYQ